LNTFQLEAATVSFMNWVAEDVHVCGQAHEARRLLMLELIDRFSEAFPEICYELIWSSLSTNAQAWRFGSQRYIRIYGGLARREELTRNGLALLLAHETGHHLGGPLYDPAIPCLSWQGQADYWAAAVGMQRVFGARALIMTIQGAAELRCLFQSCADAMVDDEPDLTPACRYEIFLAGARGLPMPLDAGEAYQTCKKW
jgi:hypothetical protein